jgi:hypothetical protein
MPMLEAFAISLKILASSPRDDADAEVNSAE